MSKNFLLALHQASVLHRGISGIDQHKGRPQLLGTRNLHVPHYANLNLQAIFSAFWLTGNVLVVGDLLEGQKHLESPWCLV